MTICRQWLLVKDHGSTQEAEPLKCRSWSCYYCAPDRRKQLIALAASGLPDTFITLTVNPSRGISPAHRARCLADAWRVIRRKAAKLQPNGKLPFFAVFEATKLGEPHLHILARSKWIDQKWLSDQMRSLTGAPIVWVERIKAGGTIFAYIAKYCGKDPQRFGNCKRYWTSQDYQVEVYAPEEDEDYRKTTCAVEKIDLQDWCNAKLSQGWFIQRTQIGATAIMGPAFRPDPSPRPEARAPPAARAAVS
jgi:hypothetical protein